MAQRPASLGALGRYFSSVGSQHNCLRCGSSGGRVCVCTISCLRFLFVEAAAEAGLWCELYNSGLVYDFGLGSLETPLAPFVQLPTARYVVGADPEAASWSFAPNYPTQRLSRLQFLALISGGAICPYGTWTQPSGVRSGYRLRAVVPASGASIYDGISYASLAASGGLLDPQGFAEVQNLGGPRGSALSVKLLGEAEPADPALNLFGAQQLLRCVDGKGSNVAIFCDPTRTVVGLNRVHSAVLLLMRLQKQTLEQAIVYFVSSVCNQSSTALALDPQYATSTWVSYFTLPSQPPRAVFPGRCTPTQACCPSQFLVQVLGNSAADGPTIWQQVVQTLGIKSFTNPDREPSFYTLSDVAQVFVQCLCTPDFLVTTADPWARLAAMQTAYLSEYCEIVFGRALGGYGVAEDIASVDLVQSLFEYQGDTFGADLVYAWWRYANYQDATFQTRTVTSLPPTEPSDVISTSGPFYVRNSCNAWTSFSWTAAAGGSGRGAPSLPPLTASSDSMTGRSQLNAAYVQYALKQMLFQAAPLCFQNPCGGRWPFLGTYDVSTGKVVDVSTATWGPALGGLYPGLVAVGSGLPAALPQTIGLPAVPFTHQFVVVAGAGAQGAPANAGGDANAPATLVFDGAWLHFDPTASPPWVASGAWPAGSVVDVDLGGASVIGASCLWDRTVPPSRVGLEALTVTRACLAPG